jgi:hypothetical protein
MAAGYAIPYKAAVAALQTGQRVAPSAFMTATVNALSVWQIELPIQVAWGTASSDATVDVYPSYDNGATWDSLPMLSFSIAKPSANSGGTARRSIRLPTGLYALKISPGGGSVTASVALLTAAVMTAVETGP